MILHQAIKDEQKAQVSNLIYRPTNERIKLGLLPSLE